MRAGFFPFYLGMMMTGLGTFLVLVSLKTTGEAVGRFHWKPILWVIGSIVVFGFLLDILGVVVTGLLLVVGVSLGGSQFRWKHSLILAVVLVAFSVLVFGIGPVATIAMLLPATFHVPPPSRLSSCLRASTMAPSAAAPRPRSSSTFPERSQPW